MGSTTIATTNGVPVLRGASTTALDTTYVRAAIEYVRSTVDPIPGSGPVLGAWYYKGVLYGFRNDDAGVKAQMWKSTTAGWTLVSTPTLVPSGRYEFVNHRFGVYADNRMFGVDGKNKGFMFDGTTFTQISTGMDSATVPQADAPLHLYVHKNHLFYMFDSGSVQHSSLGTPATWSAITGAAELSIGGEGVGFIGLQGEALLILGRHRTLILKGDSVSNWSLDTLDEESGGIEWSLQRFRNPMFLDDRGLTDLQTVDAFGDVKAGVNSQKIQSIVNTMVTTFNSSLRVKKKDQYRAFLTDGRIIIFGFDGNKEIGATVMGYPITMVVTYQTSDSSTDDIEGKEILLAGCNTGYIYRLDSGTSFDGQEVEAWLRPAFNHLKSPENKKRFFKVTIEVDAAETLDITYLPEFTYGDPNVPSAINGTIEVKGGGGAWDSPDTYWGAFNWDAQLIDTAEAHMDGVGRSMSLFIRSAHTYEAPHTIQGAIVHYSVRGVQR